jgi:hypothetical protein
MNITAGARVAAECPRKAGEPTGVRLACVPAAGIPLWNSGDAAEAPPGGTADCETGVRVRAVPEGALRFGFAPRPFPDASPALSWSPWDWQFLDDAGRVSWERKRRLAAWRGERGRRWLDLAGGIPEGELGVGVHNRRKTGLPLKVEPGEFLGFLFAAPADVFGEAAGKFTGLAASLARKEGE